MIVKIAYYFSPVGMTTWIVENQDKIEGTLENIGELALFIEENKEEIYKSFSELTFSDIEQGLDKLLISTGENLGKGIASQQLNFSLKTPYEVGIAVGKIIGYLIPEIILAVFSEAIGNLLKGALKILAKLFRLITKFGKYIFESLSKLRKAIGFVDEILDVFKSIKVAGSKNPFIKKLDEFFTKLKQFFTKKYGSVERKVDELINPIKRDAAYEKYVQNMRKKKKTPKPIDVWEQRYYKNQFRGVVAEHIGDVAMAKNNIKLNGH